MKEYEFLHSEVVLTDDGPRQRWTATGPGGREALTRLVEILGLLHDLAVPRVLASQVGEPTVVDLSWPGPTTLATTRPHGAGHALALIGTVARTLQGAHGRGVGHGRLDPSTVAIDHRGQAVITGFAPDFDLSSEGTGADAQAISHLARHLLGGLPRRPRRRDERRAAAALRRMAEPRPHSMAELVSLSSAAGPAPLVPSRPRLPSQPTIAAGIGRLAALTVIVALAAVAAMTVGLRSARQSSDPSPTPPPSRTVATEPPPPEAPLPPVRACPAIEGIGADIDGDGCLDQVWVDGTLVRSTHGSWEVGRDGDVIALGDWDCNGTATPAALRPGTGAVFVFQTWADRTPISVPPSEVSPGLTGLRVDDPDGDGCHRLLGVDATGARHEIIGSG